MKCCSACGEQKPLTDFYRDKNSKDGHIGVCKVCKYHKHKARYRENGAKWAAENRERMQELQRKWDEENRQRRIEIGREWRERNPGKSKEFCRDWAQRNKGRIAAHAAARRKRVKRATPAWADMLEIVDFYSARPEGHHVDHVIPLRGKLVSGLHVPENLQYLPGEMNMRKKNKFDPDVAKIIDRK